MRRRAVRKSIVPAYLGWEIGSSNIITQLSGRRDRGEVERERRAEEDAQAVQGNQRECFIAELRRADVLSPSPAHCGSARIDLTLSRVRSTDFRYSPDACTTCQACGGFRLLPCRVCSGSKKSLHRNHFTAEFVALKCMSCDEVGLVRCEACS
ncbi:Glutaredoxin domain-containing cysteine-rich protein CG31559 [Eumeta japonica]|uniref:Glutaredoxin domain-containing cysteine-rich protein CG31559 n=1 Tax=Eumeta variegata TaxID=151549 RepID=A0A4C1VLM9_EUMVA|nr:Glutaredoxin domain-containing cysteine-rich protein CG31559 [Eumeta japonica]